MKLRAFCMRPGDWTGAPASPEWGATSRAWLYVNEHFGYAELDTAAGLLWIQRFDHQHPYAIPVGLVLAIVPAEPHRFAVELEP